MPLSLICAMTPQRVIGNHNQLPWHMPADLQHFKALTLGKPIIMGRKTFVSIGKPLPQRRNIVLTRDKNFTAPGCEVFHALVDALNLFDTKTQDIFIIGGAEIFAQALSQADFLYLTIIHADIPGDSFFPEWHKASSQWQEISRDAHHADEKNAYNYTFVTYQKFQTL